MVKLEPKTELNLFASAFYFHTMSDCQAFLHVFKDHWCNVPWKAPVEATDFPEASVYDREVMDKDPRQRADSNLSWGFNLVQSHGIDDTNKQKAFVNVFIGNLTL